MLANPPTPQPPAISFTYGDGNNDNAFIYGLALATGVQDPDSMIAYLQNTAELEPVGYQAGSGLTADFLFTGGATKPAPSSKPPTVPGISIKWPSNPGSDGWYRAPDPDNATFQISYDSNYQGGVAWDYSDPSNGTGVLADNLDNGKAPTSLRQAVALYEAKYGGVPENTLSKLGLVVRGFGPSPRRPN